MMEIIKGIFGLALVACMFIISCMLGVLPLVIGFWAWHALLG